MNIYEKLMNIQQELKAPKGQFNKFGGYKYRSCEDILEAVKPLLAKYKTTLIISDELENIGERYYVKATAKLINVEATESIENTAYAREEENKKGMDGSQITGTASSYARKYALNGLFDIDDTKDADTDEYSKTTNQQEIEEKKATPKQIEILEKNYIGDNLTKLLNANNIEKLEDMPLKKASELIDTIMKKGK